MMRAEEKPMRPLIAALLLPLLLLACSEKAEQPASTTRAPTPASDPLAGKLVAQAKCVSCHGLDGLSTAPDIPHLAGQKADYLQVAMREYKEGKRGHAALQELVSQMSDEEGRNVAAYYASLASAPPKKSPKAAQAPTPDPFAAGEAASAVCAGCHGEDGNGAMEGTPSLAGQQPGYLQAALQAYKDGGRKDETMVGLVADLDRATMESLALFYASQTPKGRGKAASGDAAKGEPLSGGCGGCHGNKGVSGNAGTPSLAGQEAAYLVAAIKAYRDKSRKHEVMKGAVAALKEGDIGHVAAFYAAQEPKGADVKRSLSAEAWASRCDRCHGAGVAQHTMTVPRIDAQREEYLVMAMKAYRDGKRQQSTMHTMVTPLTDADIQSIAGFYAARAVK
jgi:cytochrome c553